MQIRAPLPRKTHKRYGSNYAKTKPVSFRRLKTKLRHIQLKDVLRRIILCKAALFVQVNLARNVVAKQVVVRLWDNLLPQ